MDFFLEKKGYLDRKIHSGFDDILVNYIEMVIVESHPCTLLAIIHKALHEVSWCAKRCQYILLKYLVFGLGLVLELLL